MKEQAWKEMTVLVYSVMIRLEIGSVCKNVWRGVVTAPAPDLSHLMFSKQWQSDALSHDFHMVLSLFEKYELTMLQ